MTRRGKGKRRRGLSALMLGFAVGPLAAHPAAPDTQGQGRAESLREYVSKAGFLFNFAKYVEWPADAFENPASPITIGIVGKDPFGEDLEKALKNKTVKDRTFTTQRFKEPADIRRCHILFIPRSEQARMAEILKQVGAQPTLTVGEEAGFCSAGGAINILIEQEKPKLEVNPDAADKAKLTIDAKLLKAATIVKPGK